MGRNWKENLPGVQIFVLFLLHITCCLVHMNIKLTSNTSLSGMFPMQSRTKHRKLTCHLPRDASLHLSLPLFRSCHLGLGCTNNYQPSVFTLFFILGLRLPKSDRLSEKLPFVSPVTSGVSSPGKHIVPTLQVYSLKSSSCFFIRMKYRVLCSVQVFINDVLSGAGCSAYLHIKQLSEETFLLLLQGINQFKASSHHLYSFQLSLLLLK